MADAPLRLAELVRSFHLGGTEGQVVELLRGLPSSYQVQVAVMNFAGPLAERVAQMGLVPGEFPLGDSVLRPQTALQVLRMAAWLKRSRVEVLHAHDFYGAVLGVPAAKLAGCRVVVGRLDLAHWHNKLQRTVLTQWTRMADHVVANAEAIRQQLIHEEGIAPERISVIHNGLDVERFDARMAEGLQAPLPPTGGEPVVVHVANMNHVVKRQEDLLDAMVRLNREGLRCHAYLVGDGPRRAELEARSASLGVTGRVHFLGHRTDVPAIYAQASVGVLCSSHEGMSNAVMEGMAAALPMVVTRVGGSPDLIQDGVSGRVVEPLQPDELARALKDVLTDELVAKRMGRAARAFVEKELTMAQLVHHHDVVYRRLAQRS